MKNNLSSKKSPYFLVFGLLVSCGLLIFSVLASIALGVADISLNSVYGALANFNGSTEHLIITTVRLPRSLIAVVVGASLGVAGSLMQGITRNPLADPSILGINAGAALAVVLGTWLGSSTSLPVYAGLAFCGAGIAAVLVYFFASLSRGGVSPLTLTLAGAALTAFTASFTSGILIISQRTLEEIRFWLAGSVAGRDIQLLWQIAPYLIISLLLAFALSKQVTVLSLGEDLAVGLGQNTLWVKVLVIICVILLAGGSVALAGPIGFIGLIVPHIVRFLVGTDYRWILPYSSIFGAILLLLADLLGRLILQPQEIPVGLIMPLLGAPFFIYLIRWKLRR